MGKYRKYIPFILAALCLLLAGCGDGADSGSAVYDAEDTRTYISVPKESDAYNEDTSSVADVTDTDTADTDDALISDTPIDTVPDTDTAETTGDVSEGITDSFIDDGVFPEFTDDPTVIDATGGIINLDGILSPMTPVEGTLMSKESDRLVLVTKYTCRMKTSGAVEVELEVGLQFYNLICGAKKDMGYITVDGETVKFSTSEINREGKGTYYLPFTTYTFECSPEKSSCDIDVGWDFRGSYAGVAIDLLTAGCTLTWDSQAG